MKDAKGHGSDPRGAHSAGIDKLSRGAYFTKTLSDGRIGVFRTEGRSLVTKFKNQLSADYHIKSQEADDHETRVSHVKDYLAERKARPVKVPEKSNQLNLF